MFASWAFNTAITVMTTILDTESASRFPCVSSLKKATDQIPKRMDCARARPFVCICCVCVCGCVGVYELCYYGSRIEMCGNCTLLLASPDDATIPSK